MAPLVCLPTLAGWCLTVVLIWPQINLSPGFLYEFVLLTIYDFYVVLLKEEEKGAIYIFGEGLRTALGE